MRKTWLYLLAALAAACGGEAATDDGGAPGDDAIEDFPTVPALPAGALELSFPEVVVPAATEVQTCYFLEPTGEDLLVNGLTSFQGGTGHHLILFRSVIAEPAGTLRDCTALNDMVTLVPVMSSVNFGLERFPAGMAVRVPAGTQLVLQQHVVNTHDKPVRLRDVAHVATLEPAEVETLAAFFGHGNVAFSLPGDGVEVESSITCTVPQEMNVLLMGPHMHEWGTRFRAEAGPPDALAPMIDIDPWQTWMRDEPEVREFSADAPLVLHAGDQIRTTCAWKNDTGETLAFPKEMCATYGYYFPAWEGEETWTCGGD